ncbi:MAG: hypothetical protein ACI4DK_01525 [Lachnospiraceae bacterium]
MYLQKWTKALITQMMVSKRQTVRRTAISKCNSTIACLTVTHCYCSIMT